MQRCIVSLLVGLCSALPSAPGLFECFAAETPGASIGDVAKAVAELWKGTTEKDKKPYQVPTNSTC